jgi:lysophospholipase L1-like esterase
MPLVRFEILACLLLIGTARAADPPEWVEPMRMAHARFTGQMGTLACFGDSITVSMAFWAPLQSVPPRQMDPDTAADYELVRRYMQAKCWREWKGPEYGSAGSMTIRWAHENIGAWLNRLNPEVALIMFGTNDLTQLDADEYERRTREVVTACLDRGTVVILSTIPPRQGQLKQAQRYAEIVRQLGGELRVPVCDYMAEILKRRPDDWDGTRAPFDSRRGYDVLTLISGDGVHPSNPREFQNDFSEEGLRTNGFALRNYLALREYARVIRLVLD